MLPALYATTASASPTIENTENILYTTAFFWYISIGIARFQPHLDPLLCIYKASAIPSLK